MVQDYHTHTNYSDGELMHRMVRAAEEHGLDAIGFADHCNVSNRPIMEQEKHVLGFNLDMTYKRRRDAMTTLREEFDIPILDAVEIDYHPEDEAQIREFFNEAGFDYTVGSVHFIDDVNIHRVQHFEQMNTAEREDAVDRYFEMLVSMIESELVDIAAHMDVIERNPALRGIADIKHYEAVAEALSSSSTVPEINGGRLLDDYGQPHPSEQFFEVLREHGIRFTFGTDSHTPDQLADSIPALEAVFDERDVEPVTLDLDRV